MDKTFFCELSESTHNYCSLFKLHIPSQKCNVTGMNCILSVATRGAIESTDLHNLSFLGSVLSLRTTNVMAKQMCEKKSCKGS